MAGAAFQLAYRDAAASQPALDPGHANLCKQAPKLVEAQASALTTSEHDLAETDGPRSCPRGDGVVSFMSKGEDGEQSLVSS